MARDIKDLLKEHSAQPTPLQHGHKARFEAKLDNAFPDVKTPNRHTSIPWLKIAAMVVVLLAVSFFGYQHLGKSAITIDGPKNTIVENTPKNAGETNAPKLTLASISPDLKKIEEYYKTGINVQLASLKINAKNKDLVDGYMQRLAELDKEYNALNAELNTVGPSEATVTALIDNLKLRLDLLFKLKNKLKELKNQNNEQFETIQS